LSIVLLNSQIGLLGIDIKLNDKTCNEG